MPSPATARAMLWVGLAAAVSRLLYFAEHARSAFFGVAVLDEAYYDGVARAILAGAPAALDASFRPLLYPLALAGAYRLGGPAGPTVAVALQHALGVATALLAVLVAARVLRSAAGGWLAGTLLALAGPPLYFEGERLITTLFTFLTTALLALLVAALGRAGGAERPASWWVAVGLVAALAVQARANALLFYPLLLVAAVVPSAKAGRTTIAVRRAAALLAGLLAVHLAFAATSSALGGRAAVVPSAGGVNLYLGNKRGADGTIPRQDHAVTYGETYRDSVEVFAVEGYRRAHDLAPDVAVAPRLVSRYWLRRAAEEVRADPGSWLGLMARKCVYLLADREIPNNKSYAFAVTHESTILGMLPVRWWLLLALAPFGVAWARRHGDRRALAALLALAAVHAGGVVLFFVTGRYRIPLWPSMAVLAAGGLLQLGRWARLGAWRRLAAGLLVVASIAAAARAIRAPGQTSFARDYFFRSIAHLEKGDVEAAAADARASLREDADDGAAWLQLGRVLLAGERWTDALDAFDQAARRLPGEPRVDNGAGVALEALGRPAEAYAAYGRAAAKAPDFAPPWTNAALLDLRAGLAERAAARLARAANLGDDTVAHRVATALSRRALGDVAAEARLAALRREHPDALERLLFDQARPLDPSVLELALFPATVPPGGYSAP